MTDLTFFTNPQSRGRIARWMLEETGVDYDTETLTYGGTMKAPEYLALNPMGKVPAIRHNGRMITECAAICAYLAETFPVAELAPRPEERADYYRWMFFAAGPLETAVSNRALGIEIPRERERMVGYGTYAQVMNTVETALAGKTYITGSRFTAADVYFGAQITWGLQFGTIENRPGLADYVARLSQRPALKRATAMDDAAAAAM
ncbi:glutathione S-transferase family protein [Martelella alba]|uniref:Glutathione S-transferase family protein n=1 Tax=Martelella alba TaxID=2590451 RepID=A0A506UJ36_9HYPH|nr:glutathione S-transferase family protein [Martelella alba]TPW33318.1 glutathione S-transferase family protein [Martelella alba]